MKVEGLKAYQRIETIVTYLHTTDKGKQAAIAELSDYRQRHFLKIVPSLSQISLTSSKTAVNR